jgi:hypothetical protein
MEVSQNTYLIFGWKSNRTKWNDNKLDSEEIMIHSLDWIQLPQYRL